ncbi:MAG: hypothetical protein KAJ49_05975 [Arcobacteraceae bacterium]|nr:hypothetical protein [Arcobacteraceae bacterium]
MLTRKDFIMVAKELGRIPERDARRTATDIQVEMLRNTNPRFDEARFRTFVEVEAKRRYG